MNLFPAFQSRKSVKREKRNPPEAAACCQVLVLHPAAVTSALTDQQNTES